MKRTIITAFVLIGLFMGHMAAAQKGVHSLDNYNKAVMPKYVVLVAEKGGFIFGSEVQVERRRSKSKEQLKWLQEYLYKNKASRNLTDLLNTMDELSFDFVNFVESSSDGLDVGAGDDVDVIGSTSKNRILFVFKRRDG